MSKFEPPKWTIYILERCLPDHLIEEVMGDMLEAFDWRLSKKGHKVAKYMFIWETIRASTFITQKTINNMNSMLLFNYLKTGVRFLWRTRTYSSFNILGLAIGIAVAWLSSVFIIEEMSFDRHHPNADRTYRIVADYYHQGLHPIGGASFMMGESFPNQIADIENFTRYKSWYILLENGKNTTPEIAHRADPGLFEILEFDFIEGGPRQFNRPDVVILSEQIANQLSIDGIPPSEITMHTYGGDTRRFSVIGIYKDLPSNSTITPEIIFPIENYALDNPRRLDGWFDINMNIILTLMEDTDPKKVSSIMTEILLANEDFEEKVEIKLQPISELHRSSIYESNNGLNPTADSELLYLVFLIGVICLIISIINFGNFAVSNHLTRFKEVAIRKIFGAERRRVFHQFISEIFLSTSLALLGSLLIIVIIAPLFSEYANKSYDVFTFFQWTYLLPGLLILIAVTLITGLYPAIVISSFPLVSALKGKFKIGGKGLIGRSFLTLQFGLAVFLITGMIVFNQQLNHLISHKPGFNASSVLQVSIPSLEEDQTKFAKQEMSKIAGVKMVSRFAGVNRTNYKDPENDVEFMPYHCRVDENYIPLLELELISGRNFEPERSKDFTNAIIVNETFVREAGLTDPIGKTVPFKYIEVNQPTIIGVVKDFNFMELTSNVGPLVLLAASEYEYQEILVKSESPGFPFLDEMDDFWRANFDPFPFYQESLEETLARQYELEAQIKELAIYGSLVAIFLACLGLMGVVGTYVKQRLKEVSIRKVNGATPLSIFLIFLKRYLGFTLAGFIIGISLAMYFLEGWLDQYVVRVSIGTEVLIMSFSAVGIVALLTIFSQLYKAMFLNPVVHLRDE